MSIVTYSWDFLHDNISIIQDSMMHRCMYMHVLKHIFYSSLPNALKLGILILPHCQSNCGLGIVESHHSWKSRVEVARALVVPLNSSLSSWMWEVGSNHELKCLTMMDCPHFVEFRKQRWWMRMRDRHHRHPCCHHQQPRLSHRGPVPSTNALSNWTATGVIGVSAVSPGTVKRNAGGHRNYAD